MSGDYRAQTPHARIAGVDEAGRGPLAGPLVVAAVVLDPARAPAGIDDSKRLSAKKREALYSAILEQAWGWSVVVIEAEEIDRRNIFQATLHGMRRAVEALQTVPTIALIDGNRCPPMEIRAHAVVEGDDKVNAISAASILAKTARDAALVQLHAQYPQYCFDQHKGYSTPLHLERLRLHGPSPVHRRSFAPVRGLLQPDLFAAA